MIFSVIFTGSQPVRRRMYHEAQENVHQCLLEDVLRCPDNRGTGGCSRSTSLVGWNWLAARGCNCPKWMRAGVYCLSMGEAPALSQLLNKRGTASLQ